MEKVYLCYERNSPDLAAQLATCDNDGSIVGYRVMSTIDRAVNWVTAHILAGMDEGYHVLPSDRRFTNPRSTEFKKDLALGHMVEVTMDCDEPDFRWYDIVVEPILVE